MVRITYSRAASEKWQAQLSQYVETSQGSQGVIICVQIHSECDPRLKCMLTSTCKVGPSSQRALKELPLSLYLDTFSVHRVNLCLRVVSVL